MSIILANGFNVINIWSETSIIYNFQLKQPKYRIENLNVPTYIYSGQRLNGRKMIPKLSNNSNNWRQCPHCSYKTRFLGNLNTHVKAMHSHDRKRRGKFEKYHYFQCDLCPYGSKRKQGLKNHMMAKHCEMTGSECPRCHTMLKNLLCVRSHLQYCGKAAIHKCNYCSFKTRYRNHLTRHMSNVHTDCIAIECPNMCGSILKNKESLRGHLNFCGTELFSVQCRYCPFRPKRKNLLKLHISRVHDDMSNITNQCPKCSKKFKKKAYLKRHVPVCDSKQVFQCATCSCTFHKKNVLEKHILDKHINSTHYEDIFAPYIHCPRCETGFKNQAGLSEHLVRCGDAVGFQCYHCPFKAKIKDHLKNHILCAHIENNELYQINMRNYIQNQPIDKPLH